VPYLHWAKKQEVPVPHYSKGRVANGTIQCKASFSTLAEIKKAYKALVIPPRVAAAERSVEASANVVAQLMTRFRKGQDVHLRLRSANLAHEQARDRLKKAREEA